MARNIYPAGRLSLPFAFGTCPNRPAAPPSADQNDLGPSLCECDLVTLLCERKRQFELVALEWNWPSGRSFGTQIERVARKPWRTTRSVASVHRRRLCCSGLAQPARRHLAPAIAIGRLANWPNSTTATTALEALPSDGKSAGRLGLVKIESRFGRARRAAGRPTSARVFSRALAVGH